MVRHLNKGLVYQSLIFVSRKNKKRTNDYAGRRSDTNVQKDQANTMIHIPDLIKYVIV